MGVTNRMHILVRTAKNIITIIFSSSPKNKKTKKLYIITGTTMTNLTAFFYLFAIVTILFSCNKSVSLF